MQKPDILWGLVAREKRSLFRVLVYTVLCMTPSIAFAVYWLLGWDRGADLQNATVLATLTLGMLTILWAFPFQAP